MTLQSASQLFLLTTSLFRVAFFALPVVVLDFGWFMLARWFLVGWTLVAGFLSDCVCLRSVVLSVPASN